MIAPNAKEMADTRTLKTSALVGILTPRPPDIVCQSLSEVNHHAAFFLGISLGTWVSTGVLSKRGVTVGALALLAMAGAMGLGQYIEATRHDKLDLLRISALGSTPFVITVLATIIART